MSFAASEFYGYYQLEPCALRVYLNGKGIKAAEPDAYHQLLVKLGERHEQGRTKGVKSFVDSQARSRCSDFAAVAFLRSVY